MLATTKMDLCIFYGTGLRTIMSRLRRSKMIFAIVETVEKSCVNEVASPACSVIRPFMGSWSGE